MGASVKIMLSYDYCHFEICKSTDENISDKEINEMRKDVQRLADEAVRQYKVAKKVAEQRKKLEWDKERFLRRIKEIDSKAEQDRTIAEMADLKIYQDNEWQKRYEMNYDYEDEYLTEGN